MRVLIVEDDPDLADGLVRALGQVGFSVDHVADGQAAIDAHAAQRFDVIVLDLGLPKVDGMSVLRRLRGAGALTPILVLTARDALEDRVQGLNLGADDYLVKPFQLAELEARLRALIRRVSGSAESVIQLGELTIDPLAREARHGGALLALTPRDFAVLEILAAKAGHVVSKDRLVSSISTWDKDFSENSVEAYVHRLRKKLGTTGVEIVTMRGFGYLIRFVPK
jgi:two-component system, OmpR family, response regulator